MARAGGADACRTRHANRPDRCRRPASGTSERAEYPVRSARDPDHRSAGLQRHADRSRSDSDRALSPLRRDPEAPLSAEQALAHGQQAADLQDERPKGALRAGAGERPRRETGRARKAGRAKEMKPVPERQPPREQRAPEPTNWANPFSVVRSMRN